MDKQDKPRFVEIIAGMANIFSKEIDSATLNLYWAVVRDMTLEDFEASAAIACRTARRFPVPYDILPRPPDTKLLATEAWAAALDHLSRYSSGDRPEDPLITEAIRRLGGGFHLSHMDVNELHSHMRREFIDTYERLWRSGWEPKPKPKQIEAPEPEPEPQMSKEEAREAWEKFRLELEKYT